MGMIILGVVIGFVVWTILWLGSDAVIRAAVPGIAPSEDLSNVPTAYLITKLIIGAVISMISGYLAVLIAKGDASAGLGLGILLLLTGIFFEVSNWNQIPLWYHFLFLFLLIPTTI